MQYVKVVLALLFVVLLICVFALFAHYLKQRQMRDRVKGNELEILVNKYIDNKRKILLVGCKDRQYIILLHPDGCMLVDKFTENNSHDIN